MENKKFAEVAVFEDNSNYNWTELTKRFSEEGQKPLEVREDDIRSPFGRDYTRILHSLAYRRLKHKTQVFFDVDNDHVCTRMEHVAHVESVAYTIANKLGLNTELVRAIAMGHDLGHAPFGHCGEDIIKNLRKDKLNDDFWHEKNGVYFVDKIELLPDDKDVLLNLHLTYAVRDGIISHCGEVDDVRLEPRKELIDLDLFVKGMSPATWEACVVKLSDKIAYLGRDIEDARMLRFLSDAERKELERISGGSINTTAIIHKLIVDVCKNSSPNDGICISSDVAKQIKAIKDFNYEHIYNSPKFLPYKAYAKLVLEEIYNVLMETYDSISKGPNWDILSKWVSHYPTLMQGFIRWIVYYADKDMIYCEKTLLNYRERLGKMDNWRLYGRLDNEILYRRMVLDFVAGMTDRFAVASFNELLKF